MALQIPETFSLFETMKVLPDATICLEKYHKARLLNSLRQLNISLPNHITWGTLTQEIKAKVTTIFTEPCKVKLTIIKSFSEEAKYSIEYSLIPPFKTNIIAGIAKTFVKESNFLANMKHASELYKAALAEEQKNGWDEALICNDEGNIIESSIANIWWVKDKKLFTPPLIEGCIAGVYRQWMMDVLPTHFTVNEFPLNREILMHADEVFLTNAIRGIRNIIRIGYKSYTDNVTEKISQIFTV